MFYPISLKETKPCRETMDSNIDLLNWLNYHYIMNFIKSHPEYFRILKECHGQCERDQQIPFWLVIFNFPSLNGHISIVNHCPSELHLLSFRHLYHRMVPFSKTLFATITQIGNWRYEAKTYRPQDQNDVPCIFWKLLSSVVTLYSLPMLYP